MVGDEALIAAGVGFRSTCPAEEIAALVREAERTAGRSADMLVAPAFKAASPALVEAAARLGLPLALIDDAALTAAQSLSTTLSDAALAAVGFASVAEACALAAAGPGARLLVARLASASATCTLAQGD